MRVLVADDSVLLRAGLASLIDAQPDMHVVAEAQDGRQAVETFRAHRPDVTLMDVSMPQLSGLEATAAICALDPEARVIVMTSEDAVAMADRALRAGARGYLVKGRGIGEIVGAIRSVHAGERYVPEELGVQLDAFAARGDRRERGVAARFRRWLVGLFSAVTPGAVGPGPD